MLKMKLGLLIMSQEILMSSAHTLASRKSPRKHLKLTEASVSDSERMKQIQGTECGHMI